RQPESIRSRRAPDGPSPPPSKLPPPPPPPRPGNGNPGWSPGWLDLRLRLYPPYRKGFFQHAPSATGAPSDPVSSTGSLDGSGRERKGRATFNRNSFVRREFFLD
ncbi:hypothetical protein GWI33_003861, partial [Rhynchophorus ferrugineus]